MAIVEIRDWEVGFNKVACTSTIRAATGFSLAEGKAVTDAVLRREVQRITVQDHLATQLAYDLAQLGAITSVIEAVDHA